jgi:hypothetical protein
MRFFPNGLNPFKIQTSFKLDLFLEFIMKNPEGFGSWDKKEICCIWIYLPPCNVWENFGPKEDGVLYFWSLTIWSQLESLNFQTLCIVDQLAQSAIFWEFFGVELVLAPKTYFFQKFLKSGVFVSGVPTELKDHSFLDLEFFQKLLNV